MPTFGNLKSGKVSNFRLYLISPSRLLFGGESKTWSCQNTYLLQEIGRFILNVEENILCNAFSCILTKR